VKILHGSDALTKILSCDFFTKSTLLLQHRVDLPLCAILQDEVKVIIVLVVVVQLQNVVVVQLVHDLHLQLYLLHQVVLKDLLFIDNLDGVHIFGNFMSDFINFSKAADSNVTIGK